MGLKELYESLPSEQREFQFGRIGVDPLTEGFHASGLSMPVLTERP